MQHSNGGPLTPSNCMIVFVDHQVGLMQFSPSIEPGRLKNNVVGLAEAARAFKIPVLLSTSWSQGPNGPTLPELRAVFPDEPIYERPTVNLWDDADCRKAIEASGRKKLVFCGISTEVCVTFPALAAVRAGYDVRAVLDCSADFTSFITQVTMHRLSAGGVEVMTWAPVLAELAANTVEHGDEIAGILGRRVPEYAQTLGYFLSMGKDAEQVARQAKLTLPPPQDTQRQPTAAMKKAMAAG